MIEFHKVWIEQCEAARDIREAFGLEKAFGYLVGEKLLNFFEAADQDPDFVSELPQFVEEVKQIFSLPEIQAYLDGVRRVGALGHVASDEAYEEMREAGAVPEDPVEWAQQILLVERMKKLLSAEVGRSSCRPQFNSPWIVEFQGPRLQVRRLESTGERGLMARSMEPAGGASQSNVKIVGLRPNE